MRIRTRSGVMVLLVVVWAGVARTADVTWSGIVNNVWDIGGTANWTGDAEVFNNGDDVTFSGGSNTDPIAISGTVRPGTVNVTSTGGPFRFSGGTLRFDTVGPNTSYSFGTAPLTLDGATLHLNYTGGGRPTTVTLTSPLATTANGGTLNLRQDAGAAHMTFSGPLTLGENLRLEGQATSDRTVMTTTLSGPITLTNNAAVNFVEPTYWLGGLTWNANAVSGGVSGNHDLTFTGPGSVSLSNGGANFVPDNFIVDKSGVTVRNEGTGSDFFSGLRSKSGKVTLAENRNLTLIRQGNWQMSDFVFNPGSVLILDDSVDRTGDAAVTHLNDSFTVGTPGAGQPETLRWTQFRVRNFRVRDGADIGTITVADGGTFQTWVTESRYDTAPAFDGNLRLQAGGTLDGRMINGATGGLGERPSGLRRAAGTLYLGDGNAATPETVTIQGVTTWATNLKRPYFIDYANHTTDDGNIVLRYVSVGSSTSQYFNVGWMHSGGTLVALREGSAGTEFAPDPGNAGVAVIGPAAGTVFTATGTVTVTTGGAVGFHSVTNLGGTGGGERGPLGPVMVSGAGNFLVTHPAGRVLAGDLTVDGGTLGGVGRFEVAGAIFTNDATYGVWLYGSATDQCGRLDVSEALAFAGGCVLTVNPTNGFAPAPNQYWYVAKAPAIAAPLPLPPLGYALEVEGEYLKLIKLDTSGYEPQVLNLPASHVQYDSAFLNGYVQSTGLAPATVSVFWGPADGGSNVAESTWAYTNTFAGNPESSVGLSTNVLLERDRYYYYRYYATNDYGGYMAGPVASFITGDVDIWTLSDAAETGPVTGRFSIVRSAALTNEALTVYYAVSGTASNGVDYQWLDGTVTIARGSTNAIVEVVPIEDSLVEGDESVILTILPGAYVVGTTPAATVWIADYAAKDLVWTGAVDGNWDAETANWTGAAPTYRDGDHVTFDDSSARNSVASRAGGVHPASVLVTNDIRTYTFSGGGIRGPTRLVKSGAGILRFLAADMSDCAFSGGLAVRQGVLKLDTQGGSPTPSYRVGTDEISLDGGTLHLNYTGGGRVSSVSISNTIATTPHGGTINLRQDTGAGNVRLDGGLRLGGNLRLEGQAVNDRTVVMTTVSGPVVLTNDVSLTFVEPTFFLGGITWNDNAVSGGVSGNHDLTFAGSGQVTLSNGGANFAPRDFRIETPVIVYAAGATDDFFSGVRGNEGKVMLGTGQTVNLIRGGIWHAADFTFGPGSVLSLNQQMSGSGSAQTIQGDFGLVTNRTLRWVQHRGGVLYVKDGAARGALTVGNGGVFQAWVTESRFDTSPLLDGDLRLRHGAVLDGRMVSGSTASTGERPSGLRRAAGTLYLGDGDANTPETVTIRGVTTWATNLKRPFLLDYANHTEDDGNVIVRYASVGSDPAQYFNVGWMHSGGTPVMFRESSAGTEFAPDPGNAGVAVIGPVGGTVFTATRSVTVTTGGTVGFHNVTNLGGIIGGERGELGPVVVAAGGALAFATNGTVRAADVTFENGAEWRVALYSNDPAEAGLIEATGELVFDANARLVVVPRPGATPKGGPWTVATFGSRSGLPKVGGGYALIVEGNALVLEALPSGSLFLMR